jgi:hypothetical protein
LLSFANDASDYAVLLADLEILRFESDLLSAKTIVAGGAAGNARQKARHPRVQVQLLSGGKQTSLPKSRRCRHVITYLFSSGYAG